jgi:hypothetical protein
VRDSALQAALAVDGKAPNLVLVVTVEEAFMHCQRSLVRSTLWNPERWPDRAGVPTLAAAIMAHARPDETAAEIEAIVAKSDAHLY